MNGWVLQVHVGEHEVAVVMEVVEPDDLFEYIPVGIVKVMGDGLVFQVAPFSVDEENVPFSGVELQRHGTAVVTMLPWKGGNALRSRFDAFFSACFSYNTNTLETPKAQNAKAAIKVCDFRNPDDEFSAFLLRK